MKYLREIYVGEIETDDSLNYLNMEKILNLGEDYDHPETITTDTDSSWGGECVPLELEALTKIVDTLRKKGATHIEIMFHEDHGGYVFNGVQIREANDLEIDIYKLEQKNTDIKQREQKIALLKKQLEDLESQNK